ncbi:MAG: IS982 family transposase [Acidobacteriota bacterium]
MLDIATVLTTMFTYIDDFCKSREKKRRGPVATLADSEIMTIALFCELMGKTSDYEQVQFVEQWLRDYFPHTIDRSQYHRRRKNLLQLIDHVREKVRDEIAMETADLHVIDSTPIPVMAFRRAGFTPLFPEAMYGYCAAKNMTYFGFKLHLVVDRNGIPIHFDLTPANVADGSMSEELLSVSSVGRTVLGDKGYLSRPVQERLLDRYGISLFTPSR